jgi:hypothetical protein
VFTRSREEKDFQATKTIGQQLDDVKFPNPDIDESQHCSQCDQFIATLKQRREEILNSSVFGNFEMSVDLALTIKSVEDMKHFENPGENLTI